MLTLPSRLDVPSGRTYLFHDLVLLSHLSMDSITLRDTPIKIASGKRTRLYVSLRGDLTDIPLLLDMVGHSIAQNVKSNMAPGDIQSCLIGLPTAGTALAIAASMASVARHKDEVSFPMMACRVMREHRKTERAINYRWVSGDDPDRDNLTFWAIDNALTSGGTIITQAERLKEDGYQSKKMPYLVFVDRQQGGYERLTKLGFKRIYSCFKLLDVIHAYRELGIWSADVATEAEEEIRCHQFA